MSLNISKKIDSLPTEAIEFVLKEYQSDTLASYQIARLVNRLFKTNITNDFIPKIADYYNIPRRDAIHKGKVMRKLNLSYERK